MFLYSRYSLHAERFGLRSFGPADLYRLRAGAELGSPFQLRGRRKSKQQLLSLPPCFRCANASWNAMGPAPGEHQKLFARTNRAGVKGVLL